MKNNKLIQRLIISLQIFYIILFFLTDNIRNIYFTFLVSITISISSLILSIMNFRNKGNFKVLLVLMSIAEILLTIFIYLLPEAGIPPLIKLF